MIKIFYKEGSIYPHFIRKGGSSGTEDISNISLSEKYRKLVPKSRKKIQIGHKEKLQHGILKCFMRKIKICEYTADYSTKKIKCCIKKKIAVVGLYKNKKAIGYELLYEPTDMEIQNGIPEWKFDMQNMSIFGTAWDFQDTTIFFWTIKGLREKGTFYKSVNIS